MRAPDPITTRTPEEIAKDVLDCFDAKKNPITPTEAPDFSVPPEVAKAFHKHYPADQTVGFLLDVQATIRKMAALDRGAPLWGNREENLKALKAIKKQAERLQTSLRDMPDTLRVLLFAPEHFNHLGTDVPSTKMQGQITARFLTTTKMLTWLRYRCSQLTGNAPGIHGNADYRKELAANEAYDFLRCWGRRPASPKSETSLFREVAALFYEGLTGEQGSDLERACIAVLKRRTEKAD